MVPVIADTIMASMLDGPITIKIRIHGSTSKHAECLSQCRTEQWKKLTQKQQCVYFQRSEYYE